MNNALLQGGFIDTETYVSISDSDPSKSKESSVMQECPWLLTLFNFVLDRIMNNALRNLKGVVFDQLHGFLKVAID